MSALPNPAQDVPNYMTEPEYLAFERDSEIKHEYINGEVIAMVGGSRNHNKIAMSISARLYLHLSQMPCEMYGPDQRVKIVATGQYTYPDISGLCDEPIMADDHSGTYTNPLFIVEVLSPSTEHYDRTKKFQAYKTIPSLQEYVLVAQDEPHIEVFRRDGDHWIYTEAIGRDTTITLHSIGYTVSLAQVYEKVDFEE